MKTIVTLWAAFLVPAAMAGDFRALNYGDDCSDVEAKESLLGGVLISPSAGQRRFAFHFQGEHLGRLVSIAYMCPDGKLAQGHYTFERTTFELGRQMYADMKRRLTREFGPPIVDEESAEFRQKLEEAAPALADPHKYFALWSSGNSVISSSLYGAAGESWHVSIVYAAKSDVLGERPK